MPFAGWIAALLLISAGPVLAAGTWAPLGLGIEGTGVTYLHVWNGQLVAAGVLTGAGGMPVNNIAAWNGTQWSALGTGWNTVRGVAEYNGQLAVFGRRPDSTDTEIALWDGTTWNTVVKSHYYDLASFNGKLYQTEDGYFGPYNTDTWTKVWEYDGTQWREVWFGWVPDLDGRSKIGVLKVVGNELYIDHSPYGDIFSYDGTSWTSHGTVGVGIVGTWYGWGLVQVDSMLYSLGTDWADEIVSVWDGTSWDKIIYHDPCFYVTTMESFQGSLILGGTPEGGCAGPDNVKSWDGANWTGLGVLPGRVNVLTNYNGTLVAAGHESNAGQNTLFVLEYLGTPTPVAITNFSVSRENGAAVLSWGITADETFAGFDVYRREGSGIDQRVNASRLSPNARSYVDRTAVPGKRYSYVLVAVGAASGEFRSQRAEITLPALSATLRQNVPNPFNPETTIRFVVPSENHVSITVYGAHGEKVRTLVERRYAPGEWAATWDGTDDAGRRVASGVYYYRMRIGSLEQSKKMVLIK